MCHRYRSRLWELDCTGEKLIWIKILQDASAVSNRPEGLALLTTIAEGTDCCNPSPPLPNHSALEKSLTSKILRLREVLDLPCQSSWDVLDQVHAKTWHHFPFRQTSWWAYTNCSPHLTQLLLDTLGVLKIAYPKCLSGLSGNHTSSVREVCHLNWIPLSVPYLQNVSWTHVHKKMLSLFSMLC